MGFSVRASSVERAATASRFPPFDSVREALERIAPVATACSSPLSVATRLCDAHSSMRGASWLAIKSGPLYIHSIGDECARCKASASPFERKPRESDRTAGTRSVGRRPDPSDAWFFLASSRGG
jgi:hypothetical protein